MTTTTNKSATQVFAELSNVRPHVETRVEGKGERQRALSYVSWANIFKEIFARYPDVTYRVIEFDADGRELKPNEHGLPFQTLWTDVPYAAQDITRALTIWQQELAIYKKATANADGVVSDVQMPVAPDPLALANATKREVIGYTVWTEMTIEGVTKKMWLPIRSKNNYAVKDVAYTRHVGYGNGYDIPVESIDSLQVNASIMRCFVKNAAMFGLGLSVYAGEDLGDEQPQQYGGYQNQPDYGYQPQQTMPNPVRQQYYQQRPAQQPVQTAPQPEPMPEPVMQGPMPEMQAQPEPQPAQPALQAMKLDDAMRHTIEHTPAGLKANLVGLQFGSLITNAANPDRTFSVIQRYAQEGGADGEAAKAILTALTDKNAPEPLHWPGLTVVGQ